MIAWTAKILIKLTPALLGLNNIGGVIKGLQKNNSIFPASSLPSARLHPGANQS
jgi:hypothetical protein